MDHRKLLSQSDIAPFIQKSDGAAIRMIVVNWGLIVLAFVLPSLWLNPLTLLVSLVILANRQLGLGILMHDCAHSALFTRRPINQWVGKWLCAAPILADLDGYRRYHLRHHSAAGTTADPDYPNYRNYPVSRRSLMRKILRDLSGLSGLKTLSAILLMHAGVIDYDMSYQKSAAKKLSAGEMAGNLWKNLRAFFVVHLVMASVLWGFGLLPFYALWWLAFMTLNMFFARIRNAAEHANVPDLLDVDPRLHARTTRVGLWERLTFAPNHVNYHLEHHWVPSVPPYRLAAFHRFLLQKGLLEGVEIAQGYARVFAQLTEKAA
ncbi:MAG: fatty acid desaturase family protein [Hahellaceae bacterium]|nr:fatty acid desaturase family protein [Hahellaceae bacterium]MCP5169249.1 fatty acid desaturase family protein [Hahellaceae bacterium]